MVWRSLNPMGRVAQACANRGSQVNKVRPFVDIQTMNQPCALRGTLGQTMCKVYVDRSSSQEGFEGLL